MSRVSSELARQISIKLTEKSRIAMEGLYTEYKELVTIAYEEQCPDAVKECYKKCQEWFYVRSEVFLNGHGFNHERVHTTRRIICNAYSDAHLKMTEKIADKLIAAKRKYEKAKKHYEDLKDETRVAILALRTFKNIRQELPEAAAMLPPPMSNALVCNFDSLHRKLKAQPELKEEVKR